MDGESNTEYEVLGTAKTVHARSGVRNKNSDDEMPDTRAV